MRTNRFLILIALTAAPLGVAFISACSSGGGGNPSAPPPPPVGSNFDSGDLNHNNQFSYTFPGADTVGYHCEHHGMGATVRVYAGAPGMTASVSIQSSPSKRFVPQIVELQPGGTVTWTNVSFDAHTVTSN